MASKILVTGATGTVGTQLVRELSRRGVQLRATVHTQVRAERIREANVELFEMDFNKPETIRRALKGIEKVYLLTPAVPEQAELANRFIDIAKEEKINFIIRQSAMGVGEEPAITFHGQHRQVEEHLRLSGLSFTILRPNSFMQNFINYYGSTILSEGKIFLPLGEGKVSFVNARDIAHMAAEILINEEGHKGKAYTLTGPEALSIYNVVDIFSKVAGRKISYIDVPADEARKAMLGMGMNEWMVNALMELHGYNKTGRAARVSNDYETVTKRKPASFDQFAKDNAKFFKRAA